MSKTNGFDFIAPYYDKLASLVYGNAIKNSQHVFLDRIPKASRILVVGGGTGVFLSELHQYVPDAHVVYVDSSARMLAIAEKAKPPGLQTVFVHCGFEDIPHGQSFDVVVTYFFLDMFSVVDLQNVITGITECMDPDCMWMVADFVRRKWWHRVLLVGMYAFFMAFAGVSVFSLPDWNRQLILAGLRKMDSRSFYSGFIESAVYKRD